MKLFVVLAHPDSSSFNHAVAQEVCNSVADMGHDVVFHDLYAERFDPLIWAEEISRDAVLPDEIAEHCHQITEADGIVVIHPNWWGQPPAILKGWVDRVIRPGVAYEFVEGDSGEGVPNGLLRAKFALIFNTSNTAAEREKNVFCDPLERIWKDCIFGLCGVSDFRRRMFETIVTSTLEQRMDWLAEVRQLVTGCIQAYDQEILK